MTTRNDEPFGLTRLPTPTLDTVGETVERVISTQRDRAQVTADAAGEATVEFGPVPNFAFWLIQSITVANDGAAASEARVYVGSAQPSNLVDGTIAGNLDVSDRNQPILVPGGETLRIEWTGATAGSDSTAVIQYQLAQLVNIGG